MVSNNERLFPENSNACSLDGLVVGEGQRKQVLIMKGINTNAYFVLTVLE